MAQFSVGVNTVNTSGTGAAVANLLSRLGDSTFLRNIPTVGRAVANQFGEMGTEMKINKALSGKPPVQPAQLSPETMRALQSLFPAVGTAAGAFGGMADK